MKNEPRISIITPTFNSEEDIEKCLLSVIKQNYSNIEHLIIDGLSSDRTIEIVKKYLNKHSNIKLISEKDAGIYDAMNKGISSSSGEWLYFLGSDDELFDSKVLSDIFNYKEIINSDIIYGNVKRGGDNILYDGQFSALKLMNKNICHQSIFIKKNVFNKNGLYELEYPVIADWIFNMKWFNDETISHRYVNRIIAKFGTRGISSIGGGDFHMESQAAIVKFYPQEYIELQKNILEIKNELECLNSEINLKNKEIHFIKSSKFWKMRDIYVLFKNFLNKIFK